MADRHPECAAEHMPECEPLVQFEELAVDREGRIFNGRAYIDGLARLAVSVAVWKPLPNASRVSRQMQHVCEGMTAVLSSWYRDGTVKHQRWAVSPKSGNLNYDSVQQ